MRETNEQAMILARFLKLAMDCSNKKPITYRFKNKIYKTK